MNKKRVIAIFLIFLIVGIVFLVIAMMKNFSFDSNKFGSNEVLFRYSYENHAWGYKKNGYSIYYNGDIEVYQGEEHYDNAEERYIEKINIIEKNKISTNELKRLIWLANLVEDKIELNEEFGWMSDSGVSSFEIYSERLGSWISLYKFDGAPRENTTFISKRILDFTKNLKKKYLEN